MGLRFRKSIKLGGGFRLNLSTRGVGASWGVKGFRVSTGPSGTRTTWSIPGTGLSWSSGTSLGGRRVGSPQSYSYTSLAGPAASYAQRPDPYAELQRNQYEVALHDAHVRALTGLHREGWTPWDWHAVAATPRPIEPQRTNYREATAAHALSTYTPTLKDRVWGVELRRDELQGAILAARSEDDQEHASRMASFQLELQQWEWFQRVARGVIARDPEACQAVLNFLGPFQAFQSLGSSLNVMFTRSWAVEAWLMANDQRVVPAETLSLTATGKVSRRTMPVTRYWALYQDYVCSAALRIGREVFSLLPVPVVLVHVAYPWTNTRTGLPDAYSILSVALDRDTFGSLALDTIDPSDAMHNFEHRMKYKKTTGFDEIEPLTPDDIDSGES